MRKDPRDKERISDMRIKCVGREKILKTGKNA